MFASGQLTRVRARRGQEWVGAYYAVVPLLNDKHNTGHGDFAHILQAPPRSANRPTSSHLAPPPRAACGDSLGWLVSVPREKSGRPRAPR